MLTSNAIPRIFEGLTNREMMKLQVLDSNSAIQNVKNSISITLSDGQWFSKFNVLKSQSLKLSSDVRQFDILVVKIIFNTSNKSGTLVNFNIGESGVTQKLGSPEDMQNYENSEKIMNSRRARDNHENNEENERHGRGRYLEEEDEDDIVEICNLTPYDQDWKIKGRITKKTQLRRFKNRNGDDGCVFNIHILDESNNRIQGTFFTEIAEKFVEKLKVGTVYVVKGGEVRKVRNPRYNSSGNDLEITFNKNTKITESKNDNLIPKFFYKFVTMADIESKPHDEKVDVLAIVHEVGDPSPITLKSGEEKMKNHVKLIDETGVVCMLTLWGDKATSIRPKVNDILGFSELKVRDFKGKQLSFSYDSKLIEDNLRDLPRYRKLMAERNRGVNVSKNISEFQASKRVCKKVSQVDQEVKAILNDNYESRETKLYYDIHAQITFVKEMISYPSCPNDNCKKKVVKNFEDQYECARCTKTYDEPLRNFYSQILLFKYKVPL